MSTTRSKPYHHGDLRRALIEAALELLEEEGVQALDLRKVARKAGVSHAAPYRHFEDKRALVAAVAEEGFLRLVEAMRKAIVGVSPQSQLLAISQVYVRFALNQPALMREMFSGLTIDHTAYPTLHAAAKLAHAVVIEAVESSQAAGTVVKGDAMNVAVVLWSLFHGLAMLVIEDQLPMVSDDPKMVEQLVEHCFGSLYEGIRAR